MFVLRNAASAFDESGDLQSAAVLVIRVCEVGVPPASDLQLCEAANWAVFGAVV